MTRVYICDANPRMRQLIAERLEGAGGVVGTGATARDAAEAVEALRPDVVVLDYRTAAGSLSESVAAIKAGHPAATVVVHTGVPRALIGNEVVSAGAVYSAKNEPDHLVELVRGVRTGARAAASRGS